jgi:hypothetical protein
MRRPVIAALAVSLLGLGLAVPSPAADDVQTLWRRNRRLAAEATLSASPKPYFLMDFEGRRVALMARGMVLFELPVAEALIWGRRPAIGPTAVEERDPLARPAIKPGEEKPAGGMASIDEQLLELVDMPTRYHMRLAGDVEIEVVPVATGRWPQLRQSLDDLRWRLSRPLVTLRQRRERRETTTIRLVLHAADAQRLYWSFYEGLAGILIPPR